MRLTGEPAALDAAALVRSFLREYLMPKKSALATRSPDPHTDPLLTTAEAAELLNVSPRTVEDWRLDRKLPAVKVGRLNRFRRSAVLALIHEEA